MLRYFDIADPVYKPTTTWDFYRKYRILFSLTLALVLALSPAGCGGGGAPSTEAVVEIDPPLVLSTVCASTELRTELTCNYLISGSEPSIQVDMAAFRQPEGTAIPANTFEGRLTLQGENTEGSFAQITGTASETRRHLPAFDFEFVQQDNNIIPVVRGVMSSAHAEWEYILEPGKVWDEVDDTGFSRVAIPFALQQKNQNCVHNGVLSFLFKNDGSVSKVAYQISAETCLYFKADMWGLLDAAYTPAAVASAADLIAAYRLEADGRMQTSAIEELLNDFPGAGLHLSVLGRSVSDMTLFGLVYQNTNYVGGCDTRAGTYPYCDVMVLPSYSLAKSVFAATALMRLERTYPGVSGTFIGDYVEQCLDAGNWGDVSFRKVIDMSSGNYQNPEFEVDENNSDAFFDALTHADKIDFSCVTYPRKASPGTFWNYHTSDTYVLTTAMDKFLQSQQDANKDIFSDTIVNDLWTPLGISPTARVTKRSYDSTAQAWGGYGLNLHRDDIAKIANFLNVDGGAVNQVQMLDADLLALAMQKNPASRGFDTGKGSKYQLGFWAFNAGPALNCTHAVWIPFMSGFGGITVAMLPNGMSWYYFSDGDDFSWLAEVLELTKISDLCQV